jgi:hypothetical protein
VNRLNKPLLVILALCLVIDVCCIVGAWLVVKR